ncbi:cation diffusion facilitator family transporter [Candidatus Falkowbacteria bacterium]|nr:cation diffusion facilitator family transporter [Candidatus Falkowbacteria bacterium]
MKMQDQSSGFFSVLLALLGNFTITIIKFVGFIFSGSSALFSEAVHSFADTMNQSLLMVGIRRSVKMADEQYTYGYGQERFLWALISACGIFFLGAGVTTYHGIMALNHPEVVRISPVIFLILAASLVIEAATFYFAVKELYSNNKDATWKERFEDGDPTTIAVIYEDGVAVLGVIIALISLWLYQLTGKPYWDAVGSIIIGFMLAVVAVVLIRKNRSYLINRAIPEDARERIMELLEEEPLVEKVLNFKSNILDVGVFHVKCEIEFNGAFLLKTMQADLRNDFEDIDNDFEEFKKFAVRYIDRVPRIIGQRINELEEKIQKEMPSIAHIDIEIN